MTAITTEHHHHAVVSDLMSKPVLTVEVTETLWDAWQLLFVSGLRHLVVIDDAGGVLGVLADRNILSDVPISADHLQHRKVSDVLARVPMLAISPNDTPRGAAELMTAHAVEALPVLDATSRLVGIVTEADLVHWMSKN